ncbi:MAG TPA: adenylate/guanylate cyclase domain-containing protein [Solirubrobacterales bacterium]|nr:adenylate/guanylate cyclase domain-containing protein [Solirubrobacterales bacterium]
MSTRSDETPSAPVPAAEQSTFVFADLAGFTALTEAHGDDEATRIALDFTSRVRELLPEYRAEEVKTIGDEVMIRVSDPVDAVRLGMRIVDELAFHGSPPVRVGIHSGPAMSRDGDWFGGTVNLASRVTDAAKPGEVLLTGATRGQLDGSHGFELEERGRRHFRHLVDPVPVYRAIAAGTAGGVLEVDPVCRMAVDPARAHSVKRRRGFSYYFCSERCRRAFDERPLRYIVTTPAGRLARRGFLINLAVFLVVGTTHLIAWLGPNDAEPWPPPMLFLFIAWAILLGFHYRAVRRVL